MGKKRSLNCTYWWVALCLSSLLLLPMAAMAQTAGTEGSFRAPDATRPMTSLRLPVPEKLTPEAIAVPAPGSALIDTMGYGYVRNTGEAALHQDTLWVYCAKLKTADSLLMLEESDEAILHAQEQLGAKDNGDGSWTMGDGTQVKPQFAKVQYSNEGDPVNKAISSSVLNVAEISKVRQVRAGCWRAKRRFKCGGCYSCPQGCFKSNGLLCGQECSIGLTGPDKFKLCQYTGKPWDYCVLVSAAVCTATGYDCNNCQGNKQCAVNYRWFSWTCWQGAC